MPEGDTVWRTARRLHQALAGRQLTRAELRVPQLGAMRLAGDTVLDVAPYGKHLLIRLSSGVTLHSHLRMDGAWRISPAGRPRTGGPAHEIRVILDNAQWQATGLRIHDLAVVETAREHTLIGHLGPDILVEEWPSQGLPEALRRASADPRRPVGEALLDQRIVAGIGNLYKNEALYIRGVHPWAPTADVDMSALLGAARRLMRANLEHPEQTTTGQLRRGQTHWVYGRAGSPCRRCGTLIRSAPQGADPQSRPTFWCPHCQPERPSADGGPPDHGAP